MNLLQKYLFIPLDIFQKIYHNKKVTNKTDAWLAFLCMDEPEDVIRLITDYPEFKPMYDEAYRMCRNMENIMGLFSEELRILDENTVQYMIDEMQDAINEMREIIGKQQGTIDDMKEQIGDKDSQIEALQQRIKELQQK